MSSVKSSQVKSIIKSSQVSSIKYKRKEEKTFISMYCTVLYCLVPLK